MDGAFFTLLAADKLLFTELIAGLLFAMPLYVFLTGSVKNFLLQRFVSVGVTVAGICRVGVFAALLYFTLISIAAQAYHPFLYFQF